MSTAPGNATAVADVHTSPGPGKPGPCEPVAEENAAAPAATHTTESPAEVRSLQSQHGAAEGGEAPGSPDVFLSPPEDKPVAETSDEPAVVAKADESGASCVSSLALDAANAELASDAADAGASGVPSSQVVSAIHEAEAEATSGTAADTADTDDTCNGNESAPLMKSSEAGEVNSSASGEGVKVTASGIVFSAGSVPQVGV